MSQPVQVPCPKECSGEIPFRTPHTFLEERGNYNEIYFVKCDKCGHEYEIPRKQWLFYSSGAADPKSSRAYLTKYPRIEPHTGEIVKSKDHEKETIKRMGFYEGHHGGRHGVDRRYDR